MKKSMVLWALACLLGGGAAQAAYPDHPVTLVVPYVPGGGADVIARLLSARMAVLMHGNFIVDNRSGASGTIGEAYVARSKADGYTLLYDSTPYGINKYLFPKLPYKLTDLVPVSLTAISPLVVIVPPKSTLKTIQDLVATARAQPGKITFGSGGSGTVQRLAGEYFRQQLKLNMLHVPYKSGGPAVTGVITGQIDTLFSNMAAAYPSIASGALRVLAVTGSTRSAAFPNVPTVAETEIPGYEAYEWNGLLAPAGTPPAIINQLSTTIAQILKEDQMKKRFIALGTTPVGSTPKEFADFLAKDSAKWGNVIKKGNISLE